MGAYIATWHLAASKDHYEALRYYVLLLPRHSLVFLKVMACFRVRWRQVLDLLLARLSPALWVSHVLLVSNIVSS